MHRSRAPCRGSRRGRPRARMGSGHAGGSCSPFLWSLLPCLAHLPARCFRRSSRARRRASSSAESRGLDDDPLEGLAPPAMESTLPTTEFSFVRRSSARSPMPTSSRVGNASRSFSVLVSARPAPAPARLAAVGRSSFFRPAFVSSLIAISPPSSLLVARAGPIGELLRSGCDPGCGGAGRYAFERLAYCRRGWLDLVFDAFDRSFGHMLRPLLVQLGHARDPGIR